MNFAPESEAAGEKARMKDRRGRGYLFPCFNE